MPTLPVYLTTAELFKWSEIAANETPSLTPEALAQSVLRSFMAGKNPRDSPIKGR